MKELDEHKIDKPEIHAVKPVKSETAFYTLHPKPGQFVWELDLTTRIIKKVEFSEEKNVVIPKVNILTGRQTGVTTKTIRDVIRKPGFLYCVAINHTVADKKFFKMLGIKYPTKTKKK